MKQMLYMELERRRNTSASCINQAVYPIYVFRMEVIMGKFVVKETATGFKFDLKAGNGEVIATSEVYSSKNSCLNGIESTRKNAPAAAIEDQTAEGYETAKNPKFEVYVDKAGEYRFRLKASNGQIIAVGEGYKAKAGCMNGIASIKKNAPDSPVVDITVE